MDISVIVISWNGKKFLLECLASLMAQIAPYEAELIVVDNASVDGSAEAVESAFPSVLVLRNRTNLGFAKANNLAIRKARGRFLLLVNSDVVLKKNCIDRLFTYMEENPKAGLLGPQIVSADGSVQRSCMTFPSLWNSFSRALALDRLFSSSPLFGEHLLTYWSHSNTQTVDVINGCFWVVRKEALNTVGLLDEKFFIYGEDIDWCKRFHQAGWDVVFVSDAQALHYGGMSSSNAPLRFFLEQWRTNFQYWAKHHSGNRQIAYFLIVGLHHVLRAAGHLTDSVIHARKRELGLSKVRRSVACLRKIVPFFVESRRLMRG
jgi:GT2 family glycosyltransferase